MSTISKVSILTIAAIVGFGAAPASATNPNAMTWTASEIPGVTGGPNATAVVHLNCHGGGNSCEPYSGDTPKNTALHMVCFVPGNDPEPAAYTSHFDTNWVQGSRAVNNWRFYHGYSGGQVGLTSKLHAGAISSRADADMACKCPVFGLGDPNARMLEFHDNGVGGWGMGARIHPNSRGKSKLKDPSMHGHERFWVSINDQNSNPWD